MMDEFVRTSMYVSVTSLDDFAHWHVVAAKINHFYEASSLTLVKRLLHQIEPLRPLQLLFVRSKVQSL